MEMARKKRDPKKVALAQAILDAYQPETAEDMNNALKDLFGPMFETMLQGEMNHHLGYGSNDKGPKKDDNRRNGYGKKTLKTTQGEVEIEVPGDRDGHLNHRSSRNDKKMCLLLKRKYWLCMLAACHSGIFLPRLKIFMALRCRTI